MRLSFFSTLAAFAIMAGQQAPKAVPLYNLELNEVQHEPVWAAQTEKLEIDKSKEKKLQEQQIQVLHDKIVSLEKNLLSLVRDTLVSDDKEDVSMHERSQEDYKNELDVYKNSYSELKEIKLKVNDKPIIQTVESFQKFKDTFNEKIKPWYEEDDYRGMKQVKEQFEEIYSKFIKAPKKQFKKIANEGLKIAMEDIETMYYNVGNCRENDWDIETEEIDK